MRQRSFQRMLAAGILASFPLNALADLPTVRIESLNGQNTLVGELVEFDGQAYQIRTALGTFRIAAQGVVCKGDGCPRDLSLPIAGPQELTEGLMPSLVKAFAKEKQIEIKLKEGPTAVKLVMAGGLAADVLFEAKSSTRSLEQLMTDQSGLAVTTRAIG